VGEPREAKGEARALRLRGERIKVAWDRVTLLRRLRVGELDGEER
jgi:hypothetical protein